MNGDPEAAYLHSLVITCCHRWLQMLTWLNREKAILSVKGVST
jgi:hypothetical protein